MLRLLALRQTSEDGRFVYWKARPVGEIEGTGIHAYWYRKKPQAVDVEATAYALLAQIEYAKANSPGMVIFRKESSGTVF